MKMIFSAVASAFVLMGASVSAESYYAVKLSELEFLEDGEDLKDALGSEVRFSQRKALVNVRCGQESYVGYEGAEDGQPDVAQGGLEIVFRLDKEEVVKGFLDLEVQQEGGDGFYIVTKEFAFSFTPGKETLSTKEHFREIRMTHAGWLAQDHLPGTAWFRHLSGAAEAAEQNDRRTDLADSFGFFSGGRAVSENLSLDRELILAEGKDGTMVPISEIKGVTVAAIDWAGRLPEGEVKIDSLAMSLPEDQHAVFAKGLPELLGLTARIEDELMPSTQAYSVRNPFRKLASRYRKQMGLDVPDMVVKLMPTGTIALTGGDPFFPQGTDVAVLIESKSAKLLYAAMLKAISNKAEQAGAAALDVKEGKYFHKAFDNAERSFSSHLWRMGDVVVVSNSAAQFERLVAVAEGKSPALGATDEFRFFRNRYPTSEEESAFVFLSDATIRRWAGPELRIAASRRTRAVAAMGELTSRGIEGNDPGDDFKPLLAETGWGGEKLMSSVFGTLGFLTPASELGITEATLPEKEGYESWRAGYESGWAQAFDPIAVRILDKGGELSFDLSVMPLTAGSEYGDFIELLGKAKLGEQARWVPEESMMHIALAIDTKGQKFKEYSNMAVDILPGLSVNPLAWMTGDVSLELEKSLFWEATAEDDFEKYMKIPLVLRVGSNSRLKLGLFMTAMRAEAAKSAPDAMKWETRKRGKHSYVAVMSNDENMGEGLGIFYATTSGALILSLTEEGLLRAMAREGHKLSKEETAALPAADQLTMESGPAFLAGLEGFFESTDTVQRLQEESWKALPILNEWHQRFPGKDGTEVQRASYGEDISCPGGKGYRWNAAAMTVESVAFGHPAVPKTEPAKMPGILDFENVRTGLTFQDSGLRATLKLGKTPGRIATPEVYPMVEGDGELLAKAEDLVFLKEGSVRTYEGTSFGMPSKMTSTIRNIKDAEDGKTFDDFLFYTSDEEEDNPTTLSYRLNGVLAIEKEVFEGGETTYSPAYLDLPAELISGQQTLAAHGSRAIYEMDGEKYDERSSGWIVLRVVGKEDVTVRAGEFKNCIRVEANGESLYDGMFERESYVTWYYPGIGMVKYEHTDGQDSRMELVKMPE